MILLFSINDTSDFSQSAGRIIPHTCSPFTRHIAARTPSDFSQSAGRIIPHTSTPAAPSLIISLLTLPQTSPNRQVESYLTPPHLQPPHLSYRRSLSLSAFLSRTTTGLIIGLESWKKSEIAKYVIYYGGQDLTVGPVCHLL